MDENNTFGFMLFMMMIVFLYLNSNTIDVGEKILSIPNGASVSRYDDVWNYMERDNNIEVIKLGQGKTLLEAIENAKPCVMVKEDIGIKINEKI
jgi:hypothetical protein